MRTRWLFLLLLLATLLVPVADVPAQTGNLSCTLQTATSSTGNGTACPVGGYNLITFQVGGTPGTIAFEGTQDGTNYVLLLCMNTPGLVYQNNVGAAGVYHCSVKGFSTVRARIVSAGTNITVSGVATTSTWGTAAF